MRKLDRLGWAAGLSFVSHGVRVGIRVKDPSILERVALHLPPESKPCASPIVDELCSVFIDGSRQVSGVRRYSLLYWGIRRIERTLESDEIFQALESLLSVVVSTRAPRKLFVQAAVVGWRGGGLVICGPSASGKTTLVNALVRAGATYYSDQFAVFDARGRVHAYPNRLIPHEANEGQPSKGLAELQNGRSGAKPLPVRLLVITRYRSGARWRPRILTSGQTVLALLAETILVRRRPKAALAICRRVACNAIALRGTRGEADDLARSLLKRRSHESRRTTRTAPAGKGRG